MLRRSQGLRVTKPLTASKPLERKTGLAQVGRKRREAADTAGKPVKPALTTRHKPAVPAEVLTILIARSGGRCEIGLHGCTGVGTDPAHRISRKAGGRKGAAAERHNRASNVLWACRTCHHWGHARPAEAYELGLMLREHQVPTQEPVVRRGKLVYLDDEGGVHEFEEVGV